jgi:transposase
MDPTYRWREFRGARQRVSKSFGGLRKRLEDAGKRPKAAIIDTARKLLITLNAMIATGKKYVPNAAI